jgi:hypothetical protein
MLGTAMPAPADVGLNPDNKVNAKDAQNPAPN